MKKKQQKLDKYNKIIFRYSYGPHQLYILKQNFLFIWQWTGAWYYVSYIGFFIFIECFLWIIIMTFVFVYLNCVSVLWCIVVYHYVLF